MPNRIPRAFTLIEVLVVVAIIALLVAVLMPSLAAARDHAQTIACKTRLKELYNGHVFYAQDSKQRFPHWDWWLWDGDPGGAESQARFFPGLYAKTGGTRPSDPTRWVTFGHVYRYLKDKDVYFCPKDSRRRTGGIGGANNKPIHSYSRFMEPHYYALWQKTGTSYPPTWPYDGVLDSTDFLSIDMITPGIMGTVASANVGVTCTTTPDRVGLIFEEWPTADDVLHSNQHSFSNWSLNDGYSGPLVFVDYLSTRHRNRGHVMYWDGHTFLADARFNRYPNPHYGAIGSAPPGGDLYAANVCIGARRR